MWLQIILGVILALSLAANVVMWRLLSRAANAFKLIKKDIDDTYRILRRANGKDAIE